MTSHPNRSHAAAERARARVREDHPQRVADLIEMAADDAWGALKDARQRGIPAAATITSARCVSQAARLWDPSIADDTGEALAEAVVRAFGLQPIRDRDGTLDAVTV